MRQEELDKEDIGFLKYIGAEVLEFNDGYAELSLEIQTHHRQHMGTLHGGAIATLADHAGWYAAVSLLEQGYTSVTSELKINYLKPLRGDIVSAKAKVMNQTKRTMFVTIEVIDRDVTVAYATATYTILKERN